MGSKISFVKMGVSMMIALLIANIVMMVALHEHVNDTTVILKEYRKISSDISDKDFKTDHRHGHWTHGVVHKHGHEHLEEKGQVKNEKDSDVKRLELHQKENEETSDRGTPVNAKEKPKEAKEKSNVKQRFVYDPEENADVEKMIQKLNASKLERFFPTSFWTDSFPNIAYNLGRRKKSSGTGPSKIEPVTKSSPNWKKFHAHIKRYALYDPRDPVIDGLLHDLATLPINETDDLDGGTELKVITEFTDGGRAIMKPMRYPRDWPMDPNIFVFDEIERHVAEIAAFHLDRLMGFGRVPPTIGRRINLTEFEDIAPKEVSNTFYKSPAGNTCFFGKCVYYCDSATPFCGNPDMIEVSMMAYLPSRLLAKRKSWYQPYRRSYSKWKKAEWEKDERYCDKIKKQYPFNTGKLLLDMIDVHTFDFLNGNKDRHSFSYFKELGNFSFPIVYDNGRGYGRPDYDPMSILAPLRQCCIIRKSTFLKYVKLYTGPVPLSTYMENSLAKDPIAPVLIEGHLRALDRRLVKVLKTVAGCIQNNSVNQVVIFDQY